MSYPRIRLWMTVLLPFDVVKIDLLYKRIIVVDAKLLKKRFSYLVYIADNHGRKKYFCQRNCHRVNCCNNLRKNINNLRFLKVWKVLGKLGHVLSLVITNNTKNICNHRNTWPCITLYCCISEKISFNSNIRK